MMLTPDLPFDEVNTSFAPFFLFYWKSISQLDIVARVVPGT